MNQPKRLAIVGGNSSIGRLLRARHMPGALAFVRGGGEEGARQVARYHDIAAVDLAGIDTVINCAGAVAGTDEELRDANVALPAALASACRDAGVGRLLHISSFSVYGRAEAIDDATQPDPQSEYGRSKLAGDEALLAGEGNGLTCAVLRLPAILDPDGSNRKVAKMLHVWRRAGVWPVPKNDVRRSMISSAMTAATLADLADSDAKGIVHAADKQPFSYALARRVIEEESAKRARAFPLPKPAVALVGAIAPSLHANLFADSLLAERANFASGYESDLEATLRAMLGGRKER